MRRQTTFCPNPGSTRHAQAPLGRPGDVGTSKRRSNKNTHRWGHDYSRRSQRRLGATASHIKASRKRPRLPLAVEQKADRFPNTNSSAAAAFIARRRNGLRTRAQDSEAWRKEPPRRPRGRSGATAAPLVRRANSAYDKRFRMARNRGPCDGSIDNTRAASQVHNLKEIDLDIPHRKLVVLCGLSGSGKTSLALDTLYAEGQRRYIDSFSAYTRQFLERLEKPAAERIDGIPPAIAVTHKNTSRSSRSTVGTTTETADYLRLLFAKIGEVYCLGCGERGAPRTILERPPSLAEIAPGDAIHGGLPLQPGGGEQRGLWPAFQEDGFRPRRLSAAAGQPGRRTAGPRSHESDSGRRPCWPWSIGSAAGGQPGPVVCAIRWKRPSPRAGGSASVLVDGGTTAAAGRPFRREVACSSGRTELAAVRLSASFAAKTCGLDYPAPEPRLYSFNSPLGACPTARGSATSSTSTWSWSSPTRTRRSQGAIAPWNTPAYAHELEELLALAGRLRTCASTCPTTNCPTSSGG